MKLHGIKLISFDLDGTLLDSVPDLTYAVDMTMQDLGYPKVTQEQVSCWIGNGADILITRALSQSLIVDENLSVELIQQAKSLFERYYEKTDHSLTQLYPKVKETLELLHKQGYILTLVTNKPSVFLPNLLKKYQLFHLFNDVIGGDTFAEKKPNPFALNWLLNKYQLAPKEMLMVGDSQNDIQAAKGAGCYSFGLTYGYNYGISINNSHPDIVSSTFNYLLDCIA